MNTENLFMEASLRQIAEEMMITKNNQEPFGISFVDALINTGQCGQTQIETNLLEQLHATERNLVELEDQNRELKKIIEALKENYEPFFNATEDFLFVLDEQGNILNINTTVLDRLEYAKEELIGNPILLLYPEEQHDETDRITSEKLVGKIIFCHAPIVTKSGKQIPVETKIIKGLWNGKPAIFRASKDISQIKLSEEKFSKVFDLNPSACSLSDIETGEFIQVNEAFYKLLEFDENEVTGHSAFELGIINLQAKNKIIAGSVNGKKIKNLEINLKTKNGHVKNVLLSAENIDIRYKTQQYTVFNDITESKRTEQSLAKSVAGLRELNATKDKFFSIIAHDLKSPFNAIMGFSFLLSEQIKEKNYEGIGEFADMIQRSSGRAISLLLNLLEWARSQTGRIGYHPVNVGLSLLINEVAELSYDSAKQKSINIFIDSDEKIIACIDKAMIGTVLRNLISNAIKFTNPGGTVIISAQQPSEEIRISISDNGVGMDKNSIEKLFRIDQIISKKGTYNEIGTGLGLILCKEFVQKHHGRIWAESEVGKGSRFSFTIPNPTGQ